MLLISCGNDEPVVETAQVEIPEVRKIGTFKNLTAVEFKELMNSKPGTVLDVRESDEVKSGIIDNAIVIIVNDIMCNNSLFDNFNHENAIMFCIPCLP